MTKNNRTARATRAASTLESKGADKFLHGRILYLDRLITWSSANSLTDRNRVYMGPCKF